MSSEIERKKLEFIRRGDKEKSNWLENMHKVILPSQMRKIQQNDRTVLMEMVIPKWVTWEILREWAKDKSEVNGRRCIFCDSYNEVGIDFKEKFICDNCFLKIKTLD